MNTGGFIKLSRGLVNWGWYGNLITKAVWIHILLTANYKDGYCEGIKVKAGQCVVGYKTTSRTLGISIQNLRTALKHLEDTGEIERKLTQKYSLVTIVKWGDYQYQETSTNTKLTRNQHETNTKLTTSKNIRSKEVKNKYISHNKFCEFDQRVDNLNDIVDNEQKEKL